MKTIPDPESALSASHPAGVRRPVLALLAAAALLLTVQPLAADEANTLTEEQKAEGWQLLFDGESPENHWRSFRGEELHQGWQVEDGWLVLKEPGAGDIVSLEELPASFELFMEWKVAEGTNSGIFYFVNEEQGDTIWQPAPEYQILDNSPNQSAQTAAGSLFDIIGSEQDHTKPVGEVNSARIVVQGDLVRHYLNDELLIEVDMASDWWQETVERSKFPAEYFAKTREARVGLQDHGDWVAFRNIRFRPLEQE